MSIFLDRYLPTLGAVRAEFRRRLPAAPAPRPRWPADAGAVPWGTLGHAIDLRLRLALDPHGAPHPDRHSPARATADSLAVDGLFSEKRFLAGRGFGVPAVPPSSQSVRLLDDVDDDTSARRRTVGATAFRVLELLAGLVESERPAGRPGLLLAPLAERRLGRMLMVCGRLEEVFRTGQIWPRSPLDRLVAAGADSAEQLLAAVPDAAVDDLVSMLACCAGTRQWERLRGRRPVVCGPTFAGSNLVGGADADVIAGGLLVDIKATVCPERAKLEMFRQLLGYLLLDTDDRYQLTGAGIFLARHGVLIDWPLPKLLALAGATLPLDELRAQAHDCLGADAAIARLPVRPTAGPAR
jgi:hypothetical protein